MTEMPATASPVAAAVAHMVPWLKDAATAETREPMLRRMADDGCAMMDARTAPEVDRA